jgi:hypothetical protein
MAHQSNVMLLPVRANSFAQHRMVAELDALQAEVDALKRLQAETAGKEKAEILKSERLK